MSFSLSDDQIDLGGGFIGGNDEEEKKITKPKLSLFAAYLISPRDIWVDDSTDGREPICPTVWWDGVDDDGLNVDFTEIHHYL